MAQTLQGLFGAGGGAGGTNFAGPQMPNLQNPVTQDQLTAAYGGTQQGLSAQQALLNAIQQQQGLQNQSQVYNQLQGIAAGTGPNPALAQLQQTTGQNIAAQNALMAGQRGAGANVGLMARQAAQQGGALQQQAVGQGAALAAQQQLGAIGQAGQLANVQAANQIGQTNALTQAQMAEQSNLLNAQAAYNQAQVSGQGSINAANAALAQSRMGQQAGMIGGFLQGAGSAVKSMFAEGGEVDHLADGGEPSAFTGASKFGQFLMSQPFSGNASMPLAQYQQQEPSKELQGFGQAMGQSAGQGFADLFKSQQMPAGSGANQMAQAPMLAAKGGGVHDYRTGGHVKAKSQKEKAVKSGDNYSNDKIPAVLSEHEIVLPRSVTLGPNPVNDSAKFVAQVLAKRKAGKR
jgi:hypothetical protein